MPLLQGLNTVAIARTAAEIARLRPAWERLHCHPNAAPGFVAALLAARSDRAAPFVLAVPDLDAPTALCVCRLADTRLPVRLGYRTLFQPRIRALELIHGGICGEVDADIAALLARRLVAELRAGTADVLAVEPLPLDHPIAVALRAAGAEPAVSQKHWVATLPGSYEAFLGARSGNTRRNLRRFEKGFEEPYAGRWEVRTYCAPKDLAAIARDLEFVARSTYHRGLGAGFVDDAETRALLQQGLQEGSYRAAVLAVDGLPVAYWDGRLTGSTFHTATTGYLPELQEQRPGWFLLLQLLRALCREPAITAVDFGIGDAQYKQMLCDRSWDEAPLRLFAPTLRGRWLRSLLAAVDGSARLLRRVLDRTGLTQRLKQRWRRRLAKAAATMPTLAPQPAAATPLPPPGSPSRTPPGS